MKILEVFLLENFEFLEMKFPIYMRVFVMSIFSNIISVKIYDKRDESDFDTQPFFFFFFFFSFFWMEAFLALHPIMHDIFINLFVLLEHLVKLMALTFK